MRWFCPLLLVVAGFTTLPAGDKAKMNTLTPKEVQDGWLLLFDGQTTFGWKIEGEAKVENGTLVLGGSKETRATFATSIASGDVRFNYLAKGKDSPKVILDPVGGGKETPLRIAKDWNSAHVIVAKDDLNRSTILVVSSTEEKKEDAGMGANVRTVPLGIATLSIRIDAGTTLSLKDMKLHPTQTQSLFTGKDTSGWKIFPGKKSKFAVNDKGELNIKDGPGDIQSEKSFGDFLLQLDCISNGKFLNSGVFFRCIPGQYQNGYECQIRNEFKPEPTQTYVIETYDPKTNKLINKEKVKYTAVDYGTGSMYRRQPARKEVAKDGEWFTMTVVAHGNHFASWVNGIQVTDWTDNRPKNDNPRNGFRAEAGPISLQGHDPTTDLSFRNIKVQEYPK